MQFTILTENHSDCGYAFEHGLSVYAKTDKHRLLLDSGQTGIFAYNAAKLGIDLTQVDTAILSHGHYDHSGGLLTFNSINPDAHIYMQASADGEFYNGERYIGVDKKLLALPQVIRLNGDMIIDEELSIFTGIKGKKYWPSGNRLLSRMENGQKIQDDFRHEQCLVISCRGKNVLLSGCAHNGILNILDRYHEIYEDDPVAVISGFHMMKKTEHTDEEKEQIRNTAFELIKTETVYYTGHCTGEPAFELMKEIMGDKLIHIGAGMRFEI